MQEGQLYIVRDNILKRYVTEGDKIYETTVIPRALIGQILKWPMRIWDTVVPTEHVLCLKDCITGKV